jgi:hypothetical protein
MAVDDRRSEVDEFAVVVAGVFAHQFERGGVVELARACPVCVSEHVTAGALRAEVERARRAELRARSRARAGASRAAPVAFGHDDRPRRDLGGRYDRHSAGSVGTDKLTVAFTLRAASDADAIRSARLAAGKLAELLTDDAAAVDLSAVALVVRAL